MSYGSKSLLTSGVPNLKFNYFVVNLKCFYFEIDSNCRRSLTKYIISIPEQKTSFTNITFSYEYNFVKSFDVTLIYFSRILHNSIFDQFASSFSICYHFILKRIFINFDYLFRLIT